MDRFKNIEGLSGYITGIVSGLANVLSAACVQKLGEAVPPFQLNAARYTAQVVMSFCAAVCSKKSFRIPAIKVPWLILLTVSSILFNTAYFTSAEYLPLGNLTITHVTLLYIGTVLLSKVFLDRDIRLVQFGVFLVILIGQIMLLQPCLPFDNVHCLFYNVDVNNLTKVPENMTGDGGLQINQTGYIYSLVGYTLVAGAAVVSAIRSLVYRIKMNEFSAIVLSLWIGLLGLVASLLLMLYTETPVLLISRQELLLLAGHAVLTSTASILIVHTQLVLYPVVYSILQNNLALFGFILQYSFPLVLLPGHRNVLEVVGAGVVALGIFLYVFIDFKSKNVMSLDNM